MEKLRVMQIAQASLYVNASHDDLKDDDKRKKGLEY
jgi:hypothetical protein